MSKERMQEQLNLLFEVIEKSPYLSRASREELEKEIAGILIRLGKECDDLSVWEKRILEVNKRVASQEVDAVMMKIHHLNPSSPRLSQIRKIASQLGEGTLSPEQGRLELQKVMQH